MDKVYNLLNESLKDKPIAVTDNFIWFITDIGIAALLKNNNINYKKLDVEKEALKIDLDLSREEKEFIRLDKKIIFLFYS